MDTGPSSPWSPRNPAPLRLRLVARKQVNLTKAEKGRREQVADMVSDPLTWLQQHTQTKDSHWREAGAVSPYRPFPNKPYFRPVAEAFQREPVLLIEKSRDLMLSWLCVGLFTHAVMTNDGIALLFQYQKE